MDTFLNEFFPDVYKKMKADTHTSNYCKFNSQLLTAFTSSLYIAGLVASLFASCVTRTFGRRSSMVLGGAHVLGWFGASSGSVNVYMLILGRVLLGVGIGFTNQAIPLYLTEMAPPRHRGSLYNFFELSLSLGILVANLINYAAQKLHSPSNWRVSLSVAALPASFLALASSLFLPETPSSLLHRSSDLDKTSQLLKKLRGTDDVQAELSDLVSACSASKATAHPFRKMLAIKHRPQLIAAIALPFFLQVTGINAVNFYAPVVFRTIGFKESASLMSAVVTRVVATAFNCVAILAVDRCGRRRLLLVGGIQMLASLFLVGGILASQLGDHGSIRKEYGYIILAIVCVYVAGFSLSWGPLAWLIAVEVLPLEIRSAGQSIAMAVGFLTTFVIAQGFLGMLCWMKWGIFFLFGGWVVVMTVAVYWFLPETKSVPLERMEGVWREHWYWRRFVGDGGVEIRGDLSTKG
ncbi:uncharacterized protein A4U43_C08F12100 [Asparagus officinalis]|nr:uncharacterized protein A4U43_C08F12100 [Asparagus officinalis]